MDRKSILVILICFLLLVSWRFLLNQIYPPIPVQVSTNQVSSVTNVGVETNQARISAAPNPPSAPGAPSAAQPLVVRAEIPEEVLVVTNADASYTFTSRGGGLKEIELARYRETVNHHGKKSPSTNEFASLNGATVPPVLAILGDAAWQGDGVFKLTPITNGVRAEKTLGNGLSIIKEFVAGTNYLVSVNVRLKNTSAQPLVLPAQDWVAGAATPMGAEDNNTLAMSVITYDGLRNETITLGYFSTNQSTMLVFPRTPKTEYRFAMTNIVWASAQNQYFALVTVPEKPAAGLNTHMIYLPAPTKEELELDPRAVRAPMGVQAVLNYPAVTLGPEQEVTNRFNVYGGPKEYQTLARIGARLDNHLELIMGFGGFFGWFGKALLVTMTWMHDRVSVPYGWAIVIITVLIKILFWPLTAYSTKSMKRMQALQPQIKALQEKYKDDPQKFSQKQMEFWKKNKVNPLSSCLPMTVQLPVLWGFYRMLQSAIELRGAPFLWITDLSRPDTIFLLPGFNFPVNPMPLVMGATMLWQSHLTPPSPGMDPAQQKMMRYMPLIFLLFLYNFSSGLALYWTVQNLLSILQTKLTYAQPTPPGAAPPAPVPPQKKAK